MDLLIERLHQECGQGKEILNIEAWYNWTTFDVVGTLVFGQSFRCLESTNYHPWIEFIFKTIRGNGAVVAMTYLGLGIIPELIYRSGAFGIRKVHALTEDMVTTRLNAKRNDDLFEGLVEKKDEWVSRPYIMPNVLPRENIELIVIRYRIYRSRNYRRTHSSWSSLARRRQQPRFPALLTCS